jgi:L-amino acid N-acyltransferase YncA
MITFGWEPCRVLFAEPNVTDLLQAHWDELAVNKTEAPLAPDWNKLIALEDQGLYRVWAARDGKTLVGYIGWWVYPHPHYRHTLHAIDDLYMLSPPYRRGLNGYRMFTTSIDALRELGVKRCMMHSKVHFQTERGGLRRLFERLGFTHTDELWVKIL